MAYAFKKKKWIFLASVIDAIGYLFKKPLAQKNIKPNRILVVRLDQLGDVTLALPFLNSLRKAFPESTIDVLTTPVGADLLRMTSITSDTIVWNCPFFDKTRHSDQSWFDVLNVIRERQYDCAFELRGDIRLIAILKAAGVKNIVGYGATGGGFLLDVHPNWEPRQHALEKNLKLLSAIGIHGNFSFPKIESSITSNLADKIRLAIHPDAGTSAKRWAPQHFSELMMALYKKNPQFEFHLVGSNADLGARLENQMPTFVTNHMGKTTIEQLVGILNSCVGLISNDSGPAHVMAALQKQVWVLWSGTAEESIWAPRGEKVALFSNKVACSPCALRECPIPNHPCMEGIDLKSVFTNIAEFFELNSSSQ